MFDANDHRMMARALRLAERGLYTTSPNPRVGCVIARGQRIVGEGYHLRAGEPHAEINALRAAGDSARGATAYVTLEPCSHHGRTPPCCEALAKAGVTRVVAAMRDPNPQVAGNGLAFLRRRGIAVLSGLMADQACQLNAGFISRMTRGRPWVRVKLAASLDGRTAMASGESMWITGEAARADVQRWRARADCVLTGSGTVLIDDPQMNLRISGEALGIDGEPRQPRRAIIDGRLRTRPDARMLQLPGDVHLFTAGDASGERAAVLRQRGVVIHALPSQRADRVDLAAALSTLAEMGDNEVHVEAGAGLAGALLSAELVDEMVLYLAPRLMGDAARGLFHLPGLSRMEQHLALEITDVRSIGRDLRLHIVPSGATN